MVISINQYGVKIKNIEASTLWEYNRHMRSRYEWTHSLFANSLFLDYLKEHGLKIQKDGSTRDIICLEFNYGTRSYQDEMAHLKTIAKKARTEYQLAKSRGCRKQMLQKQKKRRKIAALFQNAQSNREHYIHYSKEEIRTIFYNDGTDIEYPSRTRNGAASRKDHIHYKMLYRSTGKAKKGSCIFLCDRLYQRAIRFLYMGIRLPKNNAPIVESSAYASLIASSIMGKYRSIQKTY